MARLNYFQTKYSFLYIHSTTSGDLNLTTQLYIGGVESSVRLPWHVWTSGKSQYFRGCIWDVEINQIPADLEDYLRQQRAAGMEVGCKTTPLNCRPRSPCADGVCNERLNGYECDCSKTTFTGKRCEAGKISIMNSELSA